jgi:tetratricopeptide (TPR) repeat protein
MARPSAIPLLLLCAGALLGFAAPSDIHSKQDSWFDSELNSKTQNLVASIRKPDSDNQLNSIALLDEIYRLREYISEPTKVGSLLETTAADASLAPTVRSEAVYLQELWNDGRATPSNEESTRNLVRSVDEARAKNEAGLAESLAAIEALHGWEGKVHAERAAELNNTAESWYRVSKMKLEAYRRTQAFQRTLELDPIYVPAVLDMADQYLAQGQVSRARSTLEAALQTYPNETSITGALLKIEINQGRASIALRGLKRLSSRPLPLAVAREIAGSYAQLGFVTEARQLAHYALNMHATGIKEQELALRLDDRAGNAGGIVADRKQSDARRTGVSAESSEGPEGDIDSERLRRLLKGQPVVTEASSRHYLADVTKLVAAWQKLPESERVQSRILADIRIDQLRPDYQVIQRVQQVIALATIADVLTYRSRSIQYSPESQDVSVTRARVHHLDGTIGEADDLGESSVADASVSMYYDLRARQYRFRDIRVGDIVELEYTISPLSNENPYGTYFAELIGFGGALRCDLQRYVLRSPSALRVSSVEHLMQAPALHRDGDENVYLWEKRDIPDLVLEARAPSWSEQGAYVHVSNFASWEELGKWYAKLVQPQFALNDELQKLVSELVARHPNRLDRIAAIDELVLNETRYVALEFGVYGFKPYPAVQTYRRKFGDCKDKATLMVALLRGAGIDADLALVRTQHLGEIVSHPSSASIFDHAIVYVPEFDLWLDGTAEFARLRELPVEDQGVMALTIDADGNAAMRRTPTTSATDNYSRRTINARIDADGTIRFSGATYVRGEDAPGLRRQLEPRDSTLGYVRDHLAQVLPAVQVQDVDLPPGSSDTVSIGFSGELSSFQGRHAAVLPSSWMPRNYLESLAPNKSRRQDLILEAPWTTEEEIHIQLPEGGNVAAMPKNKDISGEFGNAKIEYRIDGHEVIVCSTVQFNDTRIPAARYPAFREFIAQTEEAFARDIEVTLR